MPKTRAAKKKKTTTHTQLSRPIVYKEIEVVKHIGADALTVEQCSDLLGWEEETEEVSFGSDFALKDREGTKVRLANNVTNRPLYSGTIDTLIQEHLRKKWRFNAEPIIIGETGLILNGQHQLISLILADQERLTRDPERRAFYKKMHKKPLTMEKLVVYGVEESDEVVNTMDTCKPRSLMDVIYRSEYFSHMKSSERKVASAMTDHAIRLLWSRTGAGDSAFAPRRTHSESLDFLARHSRLLECVSHILTKNDQKGISEYIAPGYAAGLMYLFASCKSDGDEYWQASTPSEKYLDFSAWDAAADFWANIAQDTPQMKPLRKVYASYVHPETGRLEISFSERVLLLITAWNHVSQDRNLTEKRLKLEYEDDQDGHRFLAPSAYIDAGGIDFGDISAKEQSEKAAKKTTDMTDSEDDPTEDEIYDQAEQLREEREAKEEVKKIAKKLKAKQSVNSAPVVDDPDEDEEDDFEDEELDDEEYDDEYEDEDLE